jgi:glycosyltransferase involved in cell wall biosynthesis
MTDPDPIDVSVIVPCYNHGRFVREAIQSAEASRDARFEVIVVDDGSTDEPTLEAMAGLRRDGYQVIRHEVNQGVSAARNTGIARARGRYILPLDADNRIRLDYLRFSVAILDDAPRVGVVYGDVELFGEATGGYAASEFTLQRLLLGNFVDACAVFRRTIWEECGGYDTQIPDPRGYEDWELWLQAAKRGWEFVRIAEVMLDYRVRSDSLVRACQVPENHSRLVHYLVAKHRDLYAAHLPEVLAAKELDLVRTRAELADIRRSGDLVAGRSRHLQDTIVRMKASAFWKARNAYVRLRRLIDPGWS